MKIYVGADHRGFRLRQSLITYLQKAGYDVIDDSNPKLDPADDYPVIAQRLVKDILTSDDSEARGVLVCGSGQGICMAANRFKGIRALLGYDREAVRAARQDDDANIICLPADILEKDTANLLVETFLNTPFVPEPRYVRRIQEMDNV
jgi:ribose 5-phosphate isomerase B